jgi:hypothetical protein
MFLTQKTHQKVLIPGSENLESTKCSKLLFKNFIENQYVTKVR